jgi:hypothetical protein
MRVTQGDGQGAAASSVNGPAMLSRRLTINWTCSFCAAPVPTTASFTSRGAYSNTRGRTENVALSAAPRACPSFSALSAFLFMNTRSMATSSGRNSPVSDSTPTKISCRRSASDSPRVRMAPLTM